MLLVGREAERVSLEQALGGAGGACVLRGEAEELAGEKLALLLPVRDGEPNPWLDGLLVALRRKLPFHAWILRRLGREATLTLAEEWLEVAPGSLDTVLADQLYRETAGNPF